MIYCITPSDKVNRELWRYARGVITWGQVAELINAEISEGRFHPETDVNAIHKVVWETYDGNGRRL